jgi:hypothetical protein
MTQVKLVLACYILHNWILGFGIDLVVPDENWVPPHQPESQADSDLLSQDSAIMNSKRDAISTAMWEGRGTSRT